MNENDNLHNDIDIIEENHEEENDVKKKKKKNATLNIFQRVYQKLGLTLPVLILVTILIVAYIVVSVFLEQRSLDHTIEKSEKVKQELNNYAKKHAPNIKQYAAMKNAYNEYRNNLLNFELIFNTIEQYIPSEMVRERLSVRKKDKKVTVSISGEIQGYNAYMSVLNVLDKCNFTNPKTKDSLLNVGKVKIGGEKGDERLSEKVSFNYKFDFDTDINKYILQKTYDKALQDFSNLSSLHKYQGIILKKEQDRWIEGSSSTQNIKDIVLEKEKFLQQIAEINNTDEEGLYKYETGENFINTLKREQKLINFYLVYLNQQRKKLEETYEKLPEGEDILYYNENPPEEITEKESNSEENTTDGEDIKKETKPGVEVINVKQYLTDQLLSVDEKIIKLYIFSQYYTYLLDNNYLNTFKTIKSKKDKVYPEVIDGESKELTPDEYILHLVTTKVLPEDTNVFDIVTKLYPEEELKTKKQELITKYTTFAQNIDSELEKAREEYKKGADYSVEHLLNIDYYKHNYYRDYYITNLYDLTATILNYYVSNTSYNNSFLENDIKYNFLDFQYENNLLSFKNRFILNLKNDSLFKNDILTISNQRLFIEQMNLLEKFLRETKDIITYNNNNIECIVKDTKQEVKDIYKGVLDKKTTDTEESKEIKELDIIIKAID